jgi:hypothetical protein
VSGHFDIPLNLPHAATIAGRLVHFLNDADGVSAETVQVAVEIAGKLLLYRYAEDNPPKEEADGVVAEVLPLARDLVKRIQMDEVRQDRIGKAIRNLFECLERGEEGAELSLKAGESADSLQRPI